MNTIIETFTASLADENSVHPATAEKIVKWLETEGVLDFKVLQQTYEGIRD